MFPNLGAAPAGSDGSVEFAIKSSGHATPPIDIDVTGAVDDDAAADIDDVEESGVVATDCGAGSNCVVMTY